ncbi:MAG: F0F1 ATP synthase subunit gamma [Polyangiales bacterium]
MERLSDLQVRIKNLTELADVVGAMRSLAAVRVQQARETLPAIRKYTQVIEGALARAFALSSRIDAPPQRVPSGRNAAAIAFTSEHGFVGAFNEHILDRAAALLAAPGDCLLIVGSRGAELAHARKLNMAWTIPMSTHGGDVPQVTRRIAKEIYRRAGQSELRRVTLVYSKTASGAASEIVVSTLLPFDPAPYLNAKADVGSPPLTTLRPKVLIDRLVDELVYAELTRAAMESLASANGARLATMESAHSSIEKKLDDLSRDERRQRQNEITTELLDIVTGAEAVAGQRATTTTGGDSAREDRW